MIYEPHHEDRIIEETPHRYTEKPISEILLRSLAAGAQQFADLAYDYAVGTMLDAASGYILDRWGAIVGTQRFGSTDAVYRRAIKARIAALRSNGTIGDIALPLKLLTGASEISYHPAYPAGYRIFFAVDSPLTEAEQFRLRRIMDLTRPAGKKAEYIEGSSLTFRFDDPDRGFDKGQFGRLV